MRAGRRWAAGCLLAAALAVVAVDATPAEAKQRRPKRTREWDEQVEPIAHAVEDIRGLKFDKPVRVQFLDDEAFDRNAGGFGFPSEFRRELRREERTQRALGLLGPDDDLVEAYEESGSAGLLGYYDFNRIVVRGRPGDIVTQYVLAHELTHALHDQAFNTWEIDLGNDDLAWASYTALSEGDADRVAYLWVDRQSRERRRRFDRGYESLGSEIEGDLHLPEIIEAGFQAPYVFGRAFVEGVVASGGQRALDRLFRNPPVDDAAVVNLLRNHNAAGELVRTPRLVGGERRVGSPRSLGALGLFHLLASRIDTIAALEVADVWSGDRALLFRRGAEDCVRAAFVGRDDAGTAVLATALQQWSTAHGAATVEVDGDQVITTACTSDVTPPPASILAADRVALSRNRLVVGSLDHDADAAEVACAVDTYFDDGVLAAALLTADPDALKVPAEIRALFDGRRDVTTSSCGFDPGPSFRR